MEDIQTYEGREAYIFISYAHADAEAVLPVLSDLQRRGYRLWYDAGLVAGSEWPEYIARHLAGASLVLCFVSNAYMASDNCRRELHYALSKRIPTLNIFLENAILSPGMEMQLGSNFALFKYEMSERQFREKLYGAPLLQNEALLAGPGEASKPIGQRARGEKRPPRRRKKGRRILAWILCLALLAALCTLGIVGWSTGLVRRLWILLGQEKPTSLPMDAAAVFETELLERAARAYTGIETGEIRVSDLADLRELWLRGDGFWFSREEMEAAGETAGESGLKSLADLVWFPGLNRLYLSEPGLESLESLPLCSLEVLELDGCRFSSLQGVGKAQLLRELLINDCPLRDLGDLQNCLQLRKLSLLDTDVSDFSALRPLTKLAEFTASGCGINELMTVFRLSRLTDVTLYDCDLRGSFFKIFDRERVIVSLSLVDCKLNSTANLKDFRGLTTLRLIRTGENLDWSVLGSLPVLKSVYADVSMEQTLAAALDGSGVQLIVEGS